MRPEPIREFFPRVQLFLKSRILKPPGWNMWLVWWSLPFKGQVIICINLSVLPILLGRRINEHIPLEVVSSASADSAAGNTGYQKVLVDDLRMRTVWHRHQTQAVYTASNDDITGGSTVSSKVSTLKSRSLQAIHRRNGWKLTFSSEFCNVKHFNLHRSSTKDDDLLHKLQSALGSSN